MSVKYFVDTNILVYAHDRASGIKHERARELKETCARFPMRSYPVPVAQRTDRRNCMVHEPLGILGSTLSFAGGAVLTLDALTIRKRIRAASGTAKLQQVLAKMGRPDVLKDPLGKPLDSKVSIDLWLAARSLEWTRAGLAMMTLGFLLDLASRLGG